MLIYEKKVDGVRHLFGTLGNIPSNTDSQLTYKDNAGNTILNIDEFKFFYDKLGELFGNDSTRQIVGDNDTKINVWLNDDLIIGKVVYCNVTHNDIENVVITLAEEVAEGADTELAIEAADGYVFDGEVTATANGESITLTEDDGVYTATLTISEDTEVIVTAEVKASA